MITIFHGTNPVQSRQAFFDFLGQFSPSSIIRFDSKSVEFNQINNYLNGGALFPEENVLAIDNFFSTNKTVLDKLVSILSKSEINIVIWQDKALTAAQIKIFPGAKINFFKSDNQIFSCLNSIKPGNLNSFNRYYDLIVSQGLFDLFLYLLKGNLRRQLISSSKYQPSLVQKIYLQTIELEFQYKTGQLSFAKEIALKRVLLPLVR